MIVNVNRAYIITTVQINEKSEIWEEHISFFPLNMRNLIFKGKKITIREGGQNK
ncbi:hypothetical protein bcgnr5393_19240 [Bacillus cereus]